MPKRQAPTLGENAVLIAVGTVALIAALTFVSPRTAHDPFDQRTFPCHEDEALIYAPQFGPDRVGCMHIEGGVIAPEVWEGR